MPRDRDPAILPILGACVVLGVIRTFWTVWEGTASQDPSYLSWVVLAVPFALLALLHVGWSAYTAFWRMTLEAAKRMTPEGSEPVRPRMTEWNYLVSGVFSIAAWRGLLWLIPAMSPEIAAYPETWSPLLTLATSLVPFALFFLSCHFVHYHQCRHAILTNHPLPRPHERGYQRTLRAVFRATCVFWGLCMVGVTGLAIAEIFALGLSSLVWLFAGIVPVSAYIALRATRSSVQEAFLTDSAILRKRRENFELAGSLSVPAHQESGMLTVTVASGSLELQQEDVAFDFEEAQVVEQRVLRDGRHATSEHE